MLNQEQSPAFIAVTCKCGRGLRAKFDQAGTEVRCWDCHQMVTVPNPRQGQEVARELSDGALVVIRGPGLHLVLVAAIATTAIMAIPEVGIWLTVIAFTLAASAYGEIIHRTSRRATEDAEEGWMATLLPGSFAKVVLCLLMAAGTVIPLWFLNSGHHRSPHLDWLGRTIAGLSWTVLPVLMLIAYGNSQDGPIGVRRCFKLLARHPVAALLAIAVVPMTLVLLEIATGLILYIPGQLVFYALDFMPMPSKPYPPIISEGIVYYRLVDYRQLDQSQFMDGYFNGLRDGYSFVGAIPASLSRSTRAGLDGWLIGLTPPYVYTSVRVFTVLIMLTCLLTAFAIQARWLGAILVVGKKRPG